MTDAFYTPQVSDDPTPLLVPEAEPERIDRELPHYPASQGLALRELFDDAQLGDRLLGFIQADSERAFRDDMRTVFGAQAEQLLSPEEANERYGVPGRLSFDAPVDRSIAAWRQAQAQRGAFRDEVVANADLEWWQTLGAGFAGAVLDPVGLPLWLVPEVKAGQLATALTRSTPVLRAAGPMGRGAFRGAVEGVAGGVVYEGVNLWLHHEARDDYDFGQASFNVLFGGALGGGLGAAGGWFEGRGRPARPPAAVEAMDENTRMGAFAEALDAMVEDRAVDLSPVLATQAEARRTGRIAPERAAALNDEAAGGAAIMGRRLEEAVAVTPRGQELPVRYVLVEAEDLITSHDDDLYPNDLYPAELQPRRRDRAGAQARNRLLESELNPRRLMTDVGAETGAPIIARDGTVESGNGRTIAIRRSYRTGSEASKRYRAELEARGFDVSDMAAPVLVRERLGSLSGEERVRLTRDMNAEATEAYSPSERAEADAQAVDDGLLDMIEGPDLNAAGNRRFVKAFLDRVASDDMNRMTTADGRLSDAGLDRINAALVARAYGDRGLVEALFEATDSNIKAIGKALAEAAPEWAAMRAAVARGEVPAELDPTEALKAAVAFVRHVRARRGSIEEAMDLIVGQFDAFDGAAMTVETEAFVRSFFRTSKEGATLWKSPRSAASLAQGLRWLAGEARKVQPGPDLFGGVADAATGRQLLDALGRWFAREGDGDALGGNPLAGLFDDAAEDAGGNVRPAVGDGGREPGGQGAGEGAASVTLDEAADDAALDAAMERLAAKKGMRDATRLVEAVQSGAVDDATGDMAFLLHQARESAGDARGRWIRRANDLAANGPKPKVPKGETPPAPKGQPFADPEVARLQRDTEAMLAREGLEAAAGGADPQAVADAVTAGAFCLRGGG